MVVNASANLDAAVHYSARIVDPLVQSVASGRPLLAVHSSSFAFRGDPRWAEALGGQWIPGVSSHPPIGTAEVLITRQGKTLLGATDFSAQDERYTDLDVAHDVHVLAVHEEGDRQYPLVWTCPTAAGRVAYSALGHGTESYESAGHRALLLALGRWLVGPGEDQPARRP